VIEESLPGGRVTSTAYYRNGNVLSVADPKGQVVVSEYDRANRVTTTFHYRSNGTLEEERGFAYDRAGNVLSVTDATGTTTYTYDALYRVETESKTGVVIGGVSEADYTVTSQYDLNGNRTSVAYPGGRTLTSAYDPMNRLETVTDGAKVTTYTYDKNGNRLSCEYPNGVMNLYTYDAVNRVTHGVTEDDIGTLLYANSYCYGLVGNRREIEETLRQTDGSILVRNLVYAYDSQYRLTREAWAGESYAYAYDLAGNRLTMAHNTTVTSYTYNKRNELLAATTSGVATIYVCDENGNRIQKSIPGGDVTDYMYDTNDRLVEAKINAGTVFQASYDYRTRRLTKTENGTVTYFRYDHGVSFQEWNSGQKQLELIRGSGMGGGIGGILYTDRSGLEEYFVYNAVGHTVALTNDHGLLGKTDLYDAFGNIVASEGTSDNNRLANTKERDFSVDLDNHGFRYYDATLGRYLTRDPIGYGDGMNTYTHVYNNPINHIDPQGLQGDGSTGTTVDEDGGVTGEAGTDPEPAPDPEPKTLGSVAGFNAQYVRWVSRQPEVSKEVRASAIAENRAKLLARRRQMEEEERQRRERELDQ
jgi:RHS repeat-associated protein